MQPRGKGRPPPAGGRAHLAKTRISGKRPPEVAILATADSLKHAEGDEKFRQRVLRYVEQLTVEQCRQVESNLIRHDHLDEGVALRVTRVLTARQTAVAGLLTEWPRSDLVADRFKVLAGIELPIPSYGSPRARSDGLMRAVSNMLAADGHGNPVPATDDEWEEEWFDQAVGRVRNSYEMFLQIATGEIIQRLKWAIAGRGNQPSQEAWNAIKQERGAEVASISRERLRTIAVALVDLLCDEQTEPCTLTELLGDAVQGSPEEPDRSRRWSRSDSMIL